MAQHPFSQTVFLSIAVLYFHAPFVPVLARGILLRWHLCSSGASGEFPESKHCTLWDPVWEGSNDAYLKESFSGPEWRGNKTCVFMGLADFPCLLCDAHGRLWHESRGLSAHREGEFLPREWQTYKFTFPICVCCHSYHCVCSEWCDDLGGGKTSLFTFQWCHLHRQGTIIPSPGFYVLSHPGFLYFMSFLFPYATF